MNEKIKSFFEKIGFAFVCTAAFIVAMFCRKVFSDKRLRTERNPGADKPNDDYGRDADRAREDARKSAEQISDIVKRVKERGGEREEESPAL